MRWCIQRIFKTATAAFWCLRRYSACSRSCENSSLTQPIPEDAGTNKGPKFRKALAKILPQLKTEIVKRSDKAKGFEVLPRRWVVERTLAWLNPRLREDCRRLARDWENLTRNALAFLRLASIRLMLRKICNQS